MPTLINSEELKTSNVTLDNLLDVRKDITVSAEFSCFGSQVDGGEGFCIYFYNGTSVNSSIGSPGPGLGYAPTDNIVEIDGNSVFSGVENAVLGVGFDISGNFALPLDNFSPHVLNGDSSPHPNAVTLRKGSGDNYSYITSSSNLNSFGNFNIYQTLGSLAPVASPTKTQTRTSTHTQTFTNTFGTTPTATPTNTTTSTVTRTSSITPTKTQTSTKSVTKSITTTRSVTTSKEMYVTSTPTPTKTKTLTTTVSKTYTPTATSTVSKTRTQTPTSTGTYPLKKSVKVKITEFGRRVIVYVKNSNEKIFTKVLDKNVNLSLPSNDVLLAGLSYTTGQNLSRFYLHNFDVAAYGLGGYVTPTPTFSRTPTQTLTRTRTQTITNTVSSTTNASPTPTTTSTQTRTPSQTVTKTLTNTNTPVPTKTYTRTHTKTSSNTITRTKTQTPTNSPTATRTHTPTTTGAERSIITNNANCSYKFVFESKFTKSATVNQAVQIMINNARYQFSPNITSENLINVFRSEPDKGSVGNPDPSVTPRTDNNWTPPKAFFYNNTPMAGQETKGEQGEKPGWVDTTFVNLLRPVSINTDFTGGISPNIYNALLYLFTEGGNTYNDSLLKYAALDSSNELIIGKNAGENYNIWSQSVNEPGTAPNVLDTSNLLVRLNSEGNERGDALYNMDYVTQWGNGNSGYTKSDFQKKEDSLKIQPDNRYLRVREGEIDITFSYGTELIFYSPDNLESGSINEGYIGARLTLFTNAIQ